MLYRSALDLLESLAEATALDERKAMIQEVCQVPLLIIDDLGLNRTPPGAAQNLLEIFMRRYEKASTIVPATGPSRTGASSSGTPPSPRPSSTASSTTPW